MSTPAAGLTSRSTSSSNPESPAYLALRGITKSFGRFVALREIDLEIAPGEFVCFLGPSGCGKTTLLRVIAGLEEHDRGAIVQAGKDVSRLPASKRDFGIVFQSYALFPNLTAAENIGYGLFAQKLDRSTIAQRVDGLLELVGLPGQGHKFPAQLSGGQQQRIALARALAPAPTLLLLDEPLSALDARVRASLRNEITQLQRRLGVTTIMVTHDQIEALTMADRIVVMDQGEIVQIGTPLEIYQKPATPFVADFIGAMNFLPGVVASPASVRIGGCDLYLNGHGAGLEVGAQVRVSIRPEDVRLAPMAATPGQNSLAGTIEDVEFLGATYRLTLRLHDHGATPFVVDLAANTARELQLDVATVDAGRGWSVQLPPEYLQVYRAA